MDARQYLLSKVESRIDYGDKGSTRRLKNLVSDLVNQRVAQSNVSKASVYYNLSATTIMRLCSLDRAESGAEYAPSSLTLDKVLEKHQAIMEILQ